MYTKYLLYLVGVILDWKYFKVSCLGIVSSITRGVFFFKSKLLSRSNQQVAGYIDVVTVADQDH